jgi:WD40 repeat protein
MKKEIILILAVLITGCNLQEKSAQQIDIEPIWIRVGDSYGAIDVESSTESVECAVFSPDETKIASGAKKGWEITLWETQSGEIIWQNRAEEEIEVVNFTPDGNYVVSGGEDKKLRIWDAATGEQVKVIENLAGFDAMDVDPNQDLLAAGDEAGQILIYDTKSWELRSMVKQGPDELTGAEKNVHSDVNQLDFSDDGKHLLSAGRNGLVRLWAVGESGVLKHVRDYKGHSSSIKSVRLSPEERLVAAGAGGGEGVRIWDFETTELRGHIPGTGMIMETVAFTPDGKYLFTGGNEGEGRIGEKIENLGFENKDGMGHIRAYKVPSKNGDDFKLVMAKPVFRQEFFDFSDDGRFLVSSHEDGTLRLWEVRY